MDADCFVRCVGEGRAVGKVVVVILSRMVEGLLKGT